MLRTKEDVACHAENLLRRAKNETEKKTRCFYIAQLYYRVKEYDQVKFYAQQYLSVKPDSSSALKLLAQAYEGLDHLNDAVDCYEKCFHVDPNQKELLLKICQLYNSDKVVLNPEKVKWALDLAKSYFPYHEDIINLKERLITNGSNTDKEQYEKLLMNDVKLRPNDSTLRIKIIKLYMETNRVDLAYRTSCEIENKQLFTKKLDWYECFDLVCLKYSEKQPDRQAQFYTYWLHVLDSICTLAYSVTSKKPLNECYLPVIKLDRLLHSCSNKESSDEFRNMIDHFSAQLCFHVAMLHIKKAKSDSDYASEIQKVQIWSERKIKIGALLLFSIKNGVGKKDSSFSFSLSPDMYKYYEKRCSRDTMRFVEVYYTLVSFANNNNQGTKLFLDNINYLVAGAWRNDVYKIFDSVQEAKADESYFLKSNYYVDKFTSFPVLYDNAQLYTDFELTHAGQLHNMVWLGLCGLSNINQPSTYTIHKHLRTSIFKSLNLTTNNLNSCGVETLNQLDMDSFLYLTVLCKALDIKRKGTDQPVTLPSCVTTHLTDEKEETFWNDAFKVNSEKEGLVKECSRFDMQKVIEQIRGNNLQLPLIILLARTFTRRADTGSPVVEDACHKRALHLWNLTIINLKDSINKFNRSVDNRRLFFNYDVAKLSQSEMKAVNNEAKFFIGNYYMKCRSYEKALNFLKVVQTPESLYKQAIIYELMGVEDVAGDGGSEVLHSQNNLVTKSKDCLTRALDMVRVSGQGETVLAKEIGEKLQVVDRMLNRMSCAADDYNHSQIFNPVLSTSYSTSQTVDALPPPTGENSRLDNDTEAEERYGARSVLTSTPHRLRSDRQNTSQPFNAGTPAAGAELFCSEVLRQMKLEQIFEAVKLTSESVKNIEKRLERLENDVKSELSDIKKAVKHRGEVNMLEDEEYNTEEVLNYHNYFPRNSNLIQGASYPNPAAHLPPAAYFNPNQMYQGNIPYYGQSMPFTDSQMAEYLRTLAASQRASQLGTLATAGIPLHQPPLVSATALNHLHIASPPASHPKPPQQVKQIQATAPNNVVITTSDALPTTVPTTTPTLFVNIPAEHRLGSTPISVAAPTPTTPMPPAPHKFQIAMPSNFKLVEKAPVTDPGEDGDIEATLEISKDSDGGLVAEHDPLPNFKPIIPLPDEVETKTGEEDETVIFDCRAKLFRFVDKEWKERGLGQLKILESKPSSDDKPQFRIVMRREQVHKICANHFITEDMSLTKHASNDKSYFWWAHDFADEKVAVEKFLARFKTVDEGELFKLKFDQARMEVKENVIPKKDGSSLVSSSQVFGVPISTSKDGKINVGGFTFVSPPKIIPQESKDKQEEKQEKKPSKSFASFSFGSTKLKESDENKAGLLSFAAQPSTGVANGKQPGVKCEGSSKLFELLKPSEGSWECTGCYSRNDANAKMCLACQTPCPSFTKATDKHEKKDAGATVAKDSTLPPLTTLFKPTQGSWNCDVCLLTNKPMDDKCVACGAVKPGCEPSASTPAPSAPTGFTFGIPAASNNTSNVPPPKSLFGPISNDKSGFGQSSGGNSLFGQPSDKLTVGQPAIDKPIFGQTDISKSDKTPVFGQKSVTVFSSGSADKEIFDQPAKDKPTVSPLPTNRSQENESEGKVSSNIFTFGESGTSLSSSKFSFPQSKFSFTMTSTKETVESPKTPKSAQKSDLDDSEVDHDEDHTAGHHFQPVIEMPDLIEIKTGEEDETVLYCQRAKLYRFDKNSKEWKERGLGNIKILKHKITCKIRLLMRRELVEKLCLNHYLTPDLNLKPQDTKSWTWCAIDYSDGTQVTQQFSLRFKTPDIAREFKEKFDSIKENLSDCSDVKNKDESEDDVVFVCESPIVSDELRDKALSLKLPGNFYHYLNLPDCPGCRGCRDQHDDQELKIPQEVRQPLFEINTDLGNEPTFFGSKPMSGTPAISTANVFGATVASTAAIFSTPPAVVQEPSKGSIFGRSPASDVRTNESQISTFSFSPQTKSTFTPQGSIFGGTSFFGQNADKTWTPSPVSLDKSLTKASSENVTPSIFGGQNMPNKTTPFSSPSIFGSRIESSDDSSVANKDDSITFLNKDPGLSFEALSANSGKTGFGGDNTNFKWEGAGSMIFGGIRNTAEVGKKESEEDDKDDGGNDQEEVDPHFEPIVPLPDMIELKTGEEDEEVMFSERARLYRMDEDSKEWKERGVGTMKLLHHPQYATDRLLMRRDQVHKIVCNHLITSDLNLSPMKTSDVSYCWAAMNLSQDETEPRSELLCIRFKNRDIALQFKNAFESAQNNKQPPPSKQ